MAGHCGTALESAGIELPRVFREQKDFGFNGFIGFIGFIFIGFIFIGFIFIDKPHGNLQRIMILSGGGVLTRRHVVLNLPTPDDSKNDPDFAKTRSFALDAIPFYVEWTHVKFMTAGFCLGPDFRTGN
jgi:hypothetical protein